MYEKLVTKYKIPIVDDRIIMSAEPMLDRTMKNTERIHTCDVCNHKCAKINIVDLYIHNFGKQTIQVADNCKTLFFNKKTRSGGIMSERGKRIGCVECGGEILQTRRPWNDKVENEKVDEIRDYYIPKWKIVPFRCHTCDRDEILDRKIIETVAGFNHKYDLDEILELENESIDNKPYKVIYDEWTKSWYDPEVLDDFNKFIDGYYKTKTIKKKIFYRRVILDFIRLVIYKGTIPKNGECGSQKVKFLPSKIIDFWISTFLKKNV